MGALIGITVQLIIFTISLTITLLVWAIRLTVMLFATFIAAVSSANRR
jgi:hypothetical protein